MWQILLHHDKNSDPFGSEFFHARRGLQNDKLVFDDFRTHCVNTVGEALMPPVEQSVFAAMPWKTVHFIAGAVK